MSRTWIVADLGFGDAGKGTIVDALVRRHEARLVVRWNGGAQAGHTVVTDDGRTHTFSQLGAGSFVPGVRTHLSERMVVHPTGLLVEAEHLARKGVEGVLDRLSIAESALVTTPFHQAAGRLRELARGSARHGSCGVGVGETVRDSLDAGDDALRMRDLLSPHASAHLERVRERLRSSVVDLLEHAQPRHERAPEAAEARLSTEDERAVLDDPSIAEHWLAAVRPLLSRIVADDALGPMLAAGPAILEGAQGVLLDERVGFHPHTSWSDATTSGALALLRRHGAGGDAFRLGVVRSYATRHGEGPFPTEVHDAPAALSEPHNASDGWQGRFRVGPLDAVLLRYAIRASGGIDGLAITHCDRAAAFGAMAIAYDAVDDPALFHHDASGRAVDLREGDLGHQERLGRALRSVRPVLAPLGREPAAERIADVLGARLVVSSHGPRPGDKLFARRPPTGSASQRLPP